MTDFETKDSGERQQWSSGMMRDVQKGKPRFALMWTKLQPYEDQMLTRYARLLARGAEKYDDRNWEEGSGQEELDYAYESLSRHVAQLICGERDEDHAAAVWFNTQLIEYLRWRMEMDANEPPKGYEYESDVRHEALKRAAKMRRQERIAEGAQELDGWITEEAKKLSEADVAPLPEGPDPLENDQRNVSKVDGSAWDAEVARLLGQERQGAVGLYQFLPSSWAGDSYGTLTPIFVPRQESLPWSDRQKKYLKEALEKWGIDTSRFGL